MANVIYPLAKEAFAQAEINLASDTIKVALVDTGTYTYSASHEFYSSVSSAVVGTPQTLANKTVALGVLDADDVTFTSVTGNSVEALVIYQDTGNASTSRLIEYKDSVTGLPLTPNSTNALIRWNASGIFAL